MSLDEKFNVAADTVRKFTKRPEKMDLLELYSLYKQATVGDCNTVKPGNVEGAQKWDAWNTRKGLGKDAAKNTYITKANQLSPKYA